MSDVTAPEKDPASAPHLWGWRTWVSLAATLVILGLLATQVDFEEVWRTILDANGWLALVGLLAHYATYYFRGARWKFVLGRTPRRASRVKYGLVVFFYNAVDNVVPAKGGDVYAAHMARINFGVRRSEALGSLVFLRMIDAWIILGLAAASSWLVFSSHMPDWVFLALVFGVAFAIAASTIMIVFFLLNRRMPRWVPEKAQRMIRDFRVRMVPSRKKVLGIVVFTVIIWVLEVIWMFFLIRAFGLDGIGFVSIVFLTVIPLLASAVPVTPAGAGVVEVALYSCLRAVSVSATVAQSVTVLNRVIDYWLHIFSGVIVWAFRRKLGFRSWTESPPDETPSVTAPTAVEDP